MNRKNLPLILMLAAGAIVCIITYIQDFSMTTKLVSLFVVLLLFYILGTVLKWTLDFFDRQNEEKLAEEGEVIEKETQDIEGIVSEESAEEAGTTETKETDA